MDGPAIKGRRAPLTFICRRHDHRALRMFRDQRSTTKKPLLDDFFVFPSP